MARCICCNKWTLKTPKQSLILSDKSTVCPSCCYDYGIHPYLQPKLANLSSKEFMQYLEKCKDQKNYLEPNFYLKPFLEIDVFRGLMRTHLYAVPISVHSVIDISISAKADSYEKIYEEVYFYDSFTKSSRKKNEHKSTCLYAEGTLTLWIQDEENRFPLKFTQSFVDYCHRWVYRKLDVVLLHLRVRIWKKKKKLYSDKQKNSYFGKFSDFYWWAERQR